MESYDVVIIGGGPAGLAAALALGRGRKRVLLCDGGTRRNEAAVHVHNFVTRDGTPPAEFRRIGREQLERYPNVQVRDVRIESISGARGDFRVTFAASSLAAVRSHRVLLCTGLVDEMLPIDGFRELWGHSIFQCPYCHGWEVQERKWAYLARAANADHFAPFALKLRGWSRDVVVFTGGAFEVPADLRTRFEAAGIRLETAPVTRLIGTGKQLTGVALSDGKTVACDVLFTHPPQQQVALVRSLGLKLDEEGYVAVDPMRAETSTPGIYAAGDLTSKLQGAIFAAAAGTKAAAMINTELTADLATSGAL